MKAGEFAELFKINKTQVRYYREKGLLIPNRIKNYCDYNKQCVKDMHDILEMKLMGFSIEEIQVIKNYERLMIVFDESEYDFVLDYYKEKKKKNLDDIEALKNSNQLIDKKLNDLSHTLQKNMSSIPLSFIDDIYCTQCERDMTLNDATISSVGIKSGHFSCQCGMTYKINDGILMCQEVVMLEQRMPSENTILENPFDRISHHHIDVNHRIGYKIKEYLESLDHKKGVVFYFADADLLMMNIHEVFDPKGKYVFASYDYKSLKALKERMSKLNCQGQLLFIYLSERIPLKSGMSLIDNSSNIVSFLLGIDPDAAYATIADYLSVSDEAFSIQLFFNPFAKTLIKLPRIKEYLIHEGKNEALQIVNKNHIAELKELSRLNLLYDEDDEMTVMSYVLRKVEAGN